MAKIALPERLLQNTSNLVIDTVIHRTLHRFVYHRYHTGSTIKEVHLVGLHERKKDSALLGSSYEYINVEFRYYDEEPAGYSCWLP